MAYSSAKAALTQMVRVAALELGQFGIRVNAVHPNAVFDTGIWDEKTLQARATAYGMTVAEYKTSNVLKKEVTSARGRIYCGFMRERIFVYNRCAAGH
jgi:NAD(P)-dependent dehydrogenase (short-subunit alcohol dehydrogenase family)